MLRTPRLIDGLGASHFVLEAKVCSQAGNRPIAKATWSRRACELTIFGG